MLITSHVSLVNIIVDTTVPTSIVQTSIRKKGLKFIIYPYLSNYNNPYTFRMSSSPRRRVPLWSCDTVSWRTVSLTNLGSVEPKSTQTMKFDDIFKEIGEFGPYQRRNYLLLVVGWMLTGPIMVLSVFVMGSPDHRLE